MPPKPLLRPTGGRRDPLRVNRAIYLALVPCVALGAAVAVAVLPYLPPAPDGDSTMPRVFAGIIGMIAGLGQHRTFAWLFGHGRGPRSRRAIVARARSDAPPEDGQLMVATGTVRCERPLTSPLGGVPCAAYHYRMFTRQVLGIGRARETPVYWGYGARPFTIDAPSRRYPVPDVALLGDRPTRLEGDAAATRARDYFRSTGWQTVEYPALEVTDVDFLSVLDESTTGSRRDFALDNTRAPDVALLRLEETVITVGATVSALGQWSAARGALVRPSDSPVGLATVVTGGPEALDGKPDMPEAEPQPVSSSAIAAILAVGAFYLARVILPTVRP
jgi:hypothetical protein